MHLTSIFVQICVRTHVGGSTHAESEDDPHHVGPRDQTQGPVPEPSHLFLRKTHKWQGQQPLKI